MTDNPSQLGNYVTADNSIRQPMDHVAAEIHHLQRLTTVAGTDLPRVVADLYDYVNFAHRFREGNGPQG